MGGCFSLKQDNAKGQQLAAEKMIEYKPLFKLKAGLLDAMAMNDEHFYAPFLTYRFHNSIRKNR